MISLIVAFDQHQLIGKENQMPWHYPDDLKYFQQITMGKPLIMGRNTFESLLSYGGPLKGREHYVLTRNLDYHYEHPQVHFCSTIDSLLSQDNDWFVIGGANVYQQFLPYANRLYITHIEKTYEGDTYFPNIPWEQFECVSEIVKEPLRFCVYERRV